MAGITRSRNRYSSRSSVLEPSFAAQRLGGQTFPNVVFTKATFTTVLFNVGGCWASNRFTPNVPGVYSFVAHCGLATNVSRAALLVFQKNGAEDWAGPYPSLRTYQKYNASALIYMNGTSDYVELVIYPEGPSDFTPEYIRFSGTYISPS